MNTKSVFCWKCASLPIHQRPEVCSYCGQLRALQSQVNKLTNELVEIKKEKFLK